MAWASDVGAAYSKLLTLHPLKTHSRAAFSTEKPTLAAKPVSSQMDLTPVTLLVDAVERHADSLSSRFQLVIQARQRQSSPYCQFQIGRIVGGQVVGASQAQRDVPGVEVGLIVKRDR